MSTKGKIYDQVVFFASCGAYMAAFIFICAAYFPVNILHFKYATPYLVSTIYPVGWSFYTGNTAGQPLYDLYKVTSHHAERNDLRPFAPAYWFGLKRDSKIIGAEIEAIAIDTSFITNAIKYNICMPANGDINNYIHTDTIRYNNYHARNIIYLKGQLIISVENSPTWQEQRKRSGTLKTVTLLPLNITGP